MGSFLYRCYDPGFVDYLLSRVPRDLIPLYLTGCIIQLLTALFATSGALLHHFYGFGRPETALGLVISIRLLFYLDKGGQVSHCVCLLACSLFFGATVGPMINYFVDLDQRLIIFFMGGYALTVCFHAFGIRTRKMGVIFHINLFNLPLLMFSFIFAHIIISNGTFFNIDVPFNIKIVIPFVVSIPLFWYLGYWFYGTRTWDWNFVIPLHFTWLAVLSYSFHYSILHLMCIYMFVVFGLHHLKLQDSDTLTFVDNGHTDRPSTNALTFYTHFVGRSSYLLIHFGQISFDYIWKKIHTFYESEPGLMFCVEVLKTGCAQLYLVKEFIVRVILISIIVVTLSVLIFTFLITKVRG